MKMNRYIASFVAGSKKLIPQMLKNTFSDVFIEECLDNLVTFRTASTITPESDIPYLHNIFILVNKFGSPVMQSFECIVDWALDRDTFVQQVELFCKKNKYKKYRVYFTENVKTVSKQQSLDLIKEFLYDTLKLRYSATESEFEIWFILRREGLCYIGLRLTKKQDFQEILAPGELRPELAYTLCHLAELHATDLVLDPFCGHGAIPLCAQKYYPTKKIIASDLNPALIKDIIQSRQLPTTKVQIEQYDGYHLTEIAASTIDKIITDPPWGDFQQITAIEETYEKMLHTFYRILKRDGILVLLTTQQEVVYKVLEKQQFSLIEEHRINVNGKIASAFKLQKNISS